MSKARFMEYLTGFLMGAFLGFAIESIIVILYNLFCTRLSCTPLVYSLWILTPFPILVGIATAKAISDLHLGDYE